MTKKLALTFDKTCMWYLHLEESEFNAQILYWSFMARRWLTAEERLEELIQVINMLQS